MRYVTPSEIEKLWENSSDYSYYYKGDFYLYDRSSQWSGYFGTRAHLKREIVTVLEDFRKL